MLAIEHVADDVSPASPEYVACAMYVPAAVSPAETVHVAELIEPATVSEMEVPAEQATGAAPEGSLNANVMVPVGGPPYLEGTTDAVNDTGVPGVGGLGDPAM